MLNRKTWTSSRLLTLGLAAYLLVGLSAVAPAKENGGAWLLEPVGARAIAIQAYTALADDVSSLSLNPAGIASIKRTQVLLYTREGALDAREHYLGVIGPVSKKGSIGLAWRSAGVGDSDDAPFIQTDENGTDIGSLGYRANAFEVGYGHQINPNLRVGGMLGLAFDKWDGAFEGTPFEEDQSASGFRGLSIGVTGVAADVVNYGVALRNLGGSLGADASIPVVFNAGVAIRFPQLNPMLLAVDLEKQYVDLGESATQIRLGAEYTLEPIALRLGTSQSADRSRWFAGFGVMLSALRVDYAFQFINRASRRLDDAPRHFVSLSYLY